MRYSYLSSLAEELNVAKTKLMLNVIDSPDDSIREARLADNDHQPSLN